jgi:hypothetical protein
LIEEAEYPNYSTNHTANPTKSLDLKGKHPEERPE